VQRFITVSHKLQIVAAETQLQKSWESVSSFCSTIHCEILNSSITARTREALPSASISFRVAPEDVQKLMDHLENQGTIVQHTTESEDKTTAVVDTEARIRNLTGFRDNLRVMLAKPSTTVKDSVEIQQFRESGSVLGESIASLITVVVAIIPWLIVAVPLLWPPRKMWRKFRRDRRADRPPTASL
jgi:hypothetical protein